MKTFCVIYKSGNSEAEYWVQAESRYAARTIFNNEIAQGNLDSPCTGGIVRIVERD